MWRWLRCFADRGIREDKKPLSHLNSSTHSKAEHGLHSCPKKDTGLGNNVNETWN